MGSLCGKGGKLFKELRNRKVVVCSLQEAWPTKKRQPLMSSNSVKIKRATFTHRFVYLRRKTLLYVSDTKK